MAGEADAGSVPLTGPHGVPSLLRSERDGTMYKRTIAVAVGSFIAGGVVVGVLLDGAPSSPLYEYGITSPARWSPDRWDGEVVVDDCVRFAEHHAGKLPLNQRRSVFKNCMRQNGFTWKAKGER